MPVNGKIALRLRQSTQPRPPRLVYSVHFLPYLNSSPVRLTSATAAKGRRRAMGQKFYKPAMEMHPAAWYDEAISGAKENSYAYFHRFQREKGLHLRLMMRTGLKMLHCHSAEAVMVGDRMDTDVISGLESGMSTVLVLSGVSTRETLKTYAYRPSIVLDGVGDIAALARAEKK